MSQDTKEHILEISLLLFLQKSYKAVTLNEIVKKTGMSKGAFYHYFDSKQALFEEVVKFYFENELTNGYGTYNRGSLKEFYGDFLLHLEERVSFFKKINPSKNAEPYFNEYFLVFDALTHIPSFKERLNEHNEKELLVWESVIAQAKETGEIKSKVSNKNLAKMFMYMGDGNLIHSIFQNKKTSEIKEVMKELNVIWDELYGLLKNR